jgi:hypothetical protein
MDLLDDEILDLWKALHKFDTKYILVGGFATNLHGFNRTTADMGLWIKDTPENRKSLRDVFREIGSGDIEAIESTQFIPGFTSILLHSGFEIDIMTSLKGFDQIKFDECYKIAPIAMIEDIPVKFFNLKHLIEAKKIAGRPKDIIDVTELEKIQSQK